MNHFAEEQEGILIRGRNHVALAQFVSGQLFDFEHFLSSRDTIVDILRREGVELLWFDLWNIRYLSSAGLYALITIWKYLRDAGHQWLLCEPSPEVREILSLFRLDQLWKIQKEVFARNLRKLENEEQGFLKAIRKDPGELAHRWVYSDWLDERDDSRAELVRLLSHFAEERASKFGEYVPDHKDLLTRPLPESAL